MVSYTAQFIAEKINGSVLGDPERSISGVNSLRLASETDASFLAASKYVKRMEESKAAIVLVDEKCAAQPGENRTLIVCKDPDKAFSKVCAFFAPEPVRYEPGIHPSAVVDPSAVLDPSVSVGPLAVIEAKVTIGANTRIGAGCFVGQESTIGSDTLLDPNVTVMHRCILGSRIIIHSGTVIGGDGFGFEPTIRGLVKIPQNGIVQIDDDVEIGANTTIDRARFGKTWIRKGVKIDNLVMIGHNVIVGQGSALIAQVGIAGSAEIGRGVILSAQAGVGGHIVLGDGSRVVATSATDKDVPPGETVYGLPAEPLSQFLERHNAYKKVRHLTDRMKELEAQLAALKEEVKK